MATEDLIVKPSSEKPTVDESKMPALLRNFNSMEILNADHTPIEGSGSEPQNRKLSDYISYGVINLDKNSNPSSHEVVSWVKKTLRVQKTGHSGTLDPKVTGVLIVAIDRATRLVKSQQGAGKEYICVCTFHNKLPGGEAQFRRTLEILTGTLLQRPPVISAVKRVLRTRTTTICEVLEYEDQRNMAIFRVECEAGTYIRSLCVHLGILTGAGAHMEELRRTRSGVMDEYTHFMTMQDVHDAQHLYDTVKDEAYLRTVIQPLESILVGYKRLLIKDTCVNAICYGAKLMRPGLLRYDTNISEGDDIIMITCKGEAIALGFAVMGSSMIKSTNHGVIAKIRRVIMDRDTYPRRWGLGPIALKKKQMKVAGELDKYGRPNDNTPKDWMKDYKDYDVHPDLVDFEIPDQPDLPFFDPEIENLTDPDNSDHDKKKSHKRKRTDEGSDDKSEKKKSKKPKKDKKEKKARKHKVDQAATEGLEYD
ncbi:hypothetical protein M501DRAFT_1046423 [Patellaria atrata CBS 101060]|uniref:H/ACA ribonucleoprotein complex subunit CBF5 n=1 Tax=Patellaria atrata CBS 101060 TaxID=1346257 RepID=A0A9P4VU17_9PEZI|nr:hypothetical protein M501DRAFT_1046423 [Patellaria atrata CBS 101060]